MDLNATSVDLPAVASDLPDLADLLERKAGRNYWVPIVGAVFFLVDTIFMAEGFARPVGIGSRVLVIFIWLVSLAAVALLCLRTAPKVFEQGPLARVIPVIRDIWVTRAGTRAHPDRGAAPYPRHRTAGAIPAPPSSAGSTEPGRPDRRY